MQALHQGRFRVVTLDFCSTDCAEYSPCSSSSCTISSESNKQIKVL